MSLVKPITPHLWFDKQAKEAATFYCSLFPASKIDAVTQLRDTPSGDCDVVSFTLHGQPFMAISAGPLFKFNPSVSFLVNFDPSRDPQAREHLDATWAKLSEGGQALMPLDAYPFSPRFGWMQDRYGVSWQLILSDPSGEPRPAIMPALMFTGEVCGKAEEAGAFYRSVFEGSRAGRLVRHPEGTGPDKPGTVMYSDFRLDETWFAAMDSAHPTTASVSTKRSPSWSPAATRPNSTAIGRSCPACRRPSSAAGARTAMACPGRSPRRCSVN